MTSTRIRPGMYRVTLANGDSYNVTETPFDDGWYWTVTAYGALTSEPDLGLFRTKREALAVLATLES